MADEQSAGTQPESAEATAPAAMFAPPPSLAAAPGAYPWNPLGDPEYVALDKASRALMGKQHEAVMGGIGELEAMQADMPKPPQLEKAPQEPKAQLGQGLMQYMQAATVLGALAGGLARGNTTAALNAFAGGIKGFTQGRKDEFERQMEEWKAASARVKEDNQNKLDQYKMVFESKKMTIDQKRTALKMIAAQYQDEITFNSLEQGHILQAAQIYEKGVQQQRAFEKEDLQMQQLLQNIQQHHQDFEEMHQNAHDIAEQIIEGKVPPTTSNMANYKARTIVEGDIARATKEGRFNLTQAQLSYSAAQKQIQALNTQKMDTFIGVAGSVVNTMDEVKRLARQMKLGGYPLINNAEIAGQLNIDSNSKQGKLTTQYINAINTLKEEFTNAATGGYAPTEPAWKLADQQIRADYGSEQLIAALDESQKLIRYRINAIPQIRSLGPLAPNPYTGQTGATAERTFGPKDETGAGGVGGGNGITRYDEDGNQVQ